MAFSADDKFFVLSVKNGPSDFYVIAYDMVIKGRRLTIGHFDKNKVARVAFMPRDNSKVVIAGSNLF